MAIRHFLLWLPMIAIAFANAALRQGVFVKHFSELRAHQLSTFTLTLLCAVYVWFVYPSLRLHSGGQALLLGVVWVVLTMLFEVSLGLGTGRSLESLLEDYNLAAGRIWPVFLVCLALLPWGCFWVRK